MKLDEAKKYWEWKYNRAKDFSDMHWEADERHEHQEYVEALQIAVKALEENTELKRLLKLAVEDAKALFEACEKEYMMHDSFIEPEMCRFCKYYRTGFCKCEPVGKCQWRYADNVKGMIKNGNELDSGV